MEAEAKTVSVRSAAAALGISPSTAYEAIRQNQFPVRVIKVRSRIRIPKAALDALLN